MIYLDEINLKIWNMWARDTARKTAAEWMGTPHKNRIAVMGKGIDCLHLMRVVLTGSKIVPDYKLPYYHPGMGIGLEFNVMEYICREVLFTEKVGGKVGRMLAFGDLMIYRVGNQSNHVGIAMDGKILHSAVGIGVTIDEIETTGAEEIQSVWRIEKKGFNRRPETINLRELRIEALKKNG